MRILRGMATAALAGVVMAGCGSDGRGPAAASPEPTETPAVVDPGLPVPRSVPADGSVLLTTRYAVTVIQYAGEPLTLCLGAVGESYPPSCGGPVLEGFEWDDHRGDFEDSGGARFGDFLVEGRYDGTTFTASRVVAAADLPSAGDGGDLGDEFETRCEEPPGGWRVRDASLTTEDSQQATGLAAEKLPGYAGLFLDQSRNPMEGRDPVTIEDEYAMNDPRYMTINVLVTRDVAGAESAMRKLWGGALCVSLARYTEKELHRVQEQLSDLPGFTSAGSGLDSVYASVLYDDGTLQRWADRRFGEGLVSIGSELGPVRD